MSTEERVYPVKCYGSATEAARVKAERILTERALADCQRIIELYGSLSPEHKRNVLATLNVMEADAEKETL
jgi:predicted ATP-grasp superfamily ATP-dependent carboligase